MRVKQLELTAFGPFTGTTLDFSEQPGALQLVYGRNEAGKSSTLRALSALLFGFPARTGDAHVHEMTKLRVGATLVDASGRELSLVRRKGAKNTLLTSAGEPLEESALARLLGGIDRTLFEQMFGLDHERLRAGAEALLSGAGHLGEGLFDAGTGGQGVRKLLDQLRAEAEALYKQRGRTPMLNAALDSVEKLRKERNDALLSPQVVADQRAALAEAEAQREQAIERQRAMRAELVRLRRAIQLFPLLAEHRRKSGLGAAGAPHEQDETEQLEQLVSALNRRYGRAQTAKQERPRRETELAMLRRDLEELRTRLGPAADSLGAVTTPVRTRVRKLAEEMQTRRREHEELSRALSDERALATQHQAELERLVEQRDTALALLVEEAVREDLLAEAQRRATELARRSSELEHELAQLGVRVPAPRLSRLPLPSDQQLAELEQRWAKLERTSEALEGRLEERERERFRLSASRAELLSAGTPVSLAELERARAERDRALDNLLARASAPLDSLLALDPQLVRAVGDAVRGADELADRMRREVGQASELARLEAALAAVEAQCAELARARAEAAELHVALRRELASLAEPCGTASESPAVLRTVVRELARLSKRASELEQLGLALSELEQRALALTLRLAEACAFPCPTGKPIEVLALVLRSARERAQTARERAQRAEHARVRLRELSQGCATKEARLALVRAEQERLRDEHVALVETLGFARDTAPDELLACLDDLAQLAQRAREAQTTELALRSELAESEQLGRELRDAVRAYLPAMPELEPEEALKALALEARTRATARAQRAEQQRDLGNLERELAKLADGAPLEQLHEELSDFDLYAARARAEELEEELQRCADEVGAHQQTIGGLKAGLSTLEESSGAAEKSEELEQELSRARALARRYVELRLAIAVLTREVERYRAQHQQPLLARASTLFPELTLGRYRALEVEYDERDEPVLACVLRSGKTVRIAGLSDGTRDQLYLALRIASIEHFLGRNAPLPLVLDDAFIHFDDERAKAALVSLAALSAHTQVLFFTHHARMVELAREALGPDGVVLHELGGRAAPGRDLGPLFTGT